MSHRSALTIGLAAIAALAPGQAAARQSYDPLSTSRVEPEWFDTVVVDGERDREIPIRVWLPASRGAAPVVVFSHGLGGSRENSPYLARHWAARGYVCVFLQHPGSDEAVWRDARPFGRMRAMQRAASAENFLLRVEDVPAVLDQLERWNGEGGHALRGRLDLRRVGMTGHSFGAVTTQAVSGQRFPGGRSFTDERILAALPMSPSSPRSGAGAADPFGGVGIPWLLMTGTEDEAPIGGADVPSRLAVYDALPPGDKYQLVLAGAEHSAFSDRSLPGESGRRNPNHHRVILGLSTAFWDAYLKGDAAALAWLRGNGPRTLMEPGDRWDRK